MIRTHAASVFFVGIATIAWISLPAPPSVDAETNCEYWVAPPPLGDDNQTGSRDAPWASLTHAVEAIPDTGCVVWFEPGVYKGGQEIKRRFSRTAKFQSVSRYQAVFEHSETVIDFDGARNVELVGFEIRHSGPGASGDVINIDQGNGFWAEQVTLRDNIIHDSWDQDLLKVHNGARFVTVVGNVFYNQGPSEQQMDVNSVTDVVISDNIFFNDFAGSGRADPGNTKHYIVIKDSNEGADGLFGSERIMVTRNVFMNWQGGVEEFIKVGNDGKPYHEAEDVWIDTNLFVGNSADVVGAPFGVAGAKNVFFLNNTVVGDLPSKAFALRIKTKGSNPNNENIRLHNNIWSDPTGTMGSVGPGDSGAFASGDPDSTSGLVLEGNLYWNGGKPLPPGEVVSPADDPMRIVGDPRLPAVGSVALPRWNGEKFESGNRTIRQELVRLAEAYGRLPSNSPAVGLADVSWISDKDLRGRARGERPSLGAMEPIDSGRFVDDDNSIFEGDIEWLAAAGITRGCNPPLNDRFCPHGVVTRGQMAAFLHRALAEIILIVGSAIDFVDDDNSIFEADIEWLTAAGITRGCNPPLNDRFCPHGVATRGQMAAFLNRGLAEITLIVGSAIDFVDDDNSIFEADIEWLAAAGITRGCNPPLNDRFCPQGVVTRGQMAAFLHRALGG